MRVILQACCLKQGGWTHLNLQAIADERKVIDLGWRGSIIREPGHSLHAGRLSQEVLDQRRIELGAYLFAAQFQQWTCPAWWWFG
ncbi:hypothetical protein [Sulfitobacter sp. JB4-11]|uniref:hypothetical protein n=1 Tax=Sulfitobacter rhodophyticola TaxID=3238304 RepID=UPI003D818E67